MSSPTKERLFTGLYECSACDARYQVEDALEEDLVCEECGSDLEMEDGSQLDEDEE
jgi:transcription initiation factor IIE alpha subunit